jgi:hypothetical protein
MVTRRYQSAKTSAISTKPPHERQSREAGSCLGARSGLSFDDCGKSFDAARVGKGPATYSFGVDPLPWTVHGFGGSSQLMMLPFVFDRREITQRRVAA